MKARNEKGFTLIELIMVIVILGILAAVIVPRFFDFTSDAHKASIDTFIGNFKSSLSMYAADQMVQTGYRRYPDADEFETNASGFGILLDEVPDSWSIVSDNTSNQVKFKYDKTEPVTIVRYTSSGEDSYTFVIESGPAYVTNP
ncbi:MAG: prepilin-type N-terminal cleavage/methylation domain-containing protein [Planctomycetia bacterium]|nr:prepilin-type N-terminal cleavage/methylation domain-containing protein [Planctomycetia bacterium]